MNHERQGRMMRVYRQNGFQFFIVLCVILHAVCMNCVAASEEGVQHFKMISTVEYAGEGQFRNQTESSYSVTKEVFANDRVRYSFVTRDPNTEAGKRASSEYSFVIDRTTGLMSAAGRDMAFWAQVHNATVKSLDKVTKDYVGKTWKQSVDLSSVSGSPIGEVGFTLTAIDVRTGAFGNMIAVRALSEPFFLTIGKGPLRCKMNTVYLFDQDIDDVYLGISVFVATTDARGVQETFRHEVATYRTDAAGRPFDLHDVGTDFEALVAKVGLRKDSLQITKETDLPKWAQDKGIAAAQIANICSGAVCEGALNPIGMITIPTARSLLDQAARRAAGAGILSWLAANFGWNLPTIAVIGTAIAVPIIIAQDDDGHDYP